MKKIMFVIMMFAGIAVAGDNLYYGQKNEAVMTAAMKYLNSSEFLPASGSRDGKEVPDQTTIWCNKIDQTTDLIWYCIPKIPDKRLDLLGVLETNRIAFIEAFGITILTNPVLIVETQELN